MGPRSSARLVMERAWVRFEQNEYLWFEISKAGISNFECIGATYIRVGHYFKGRREGLIGPLVG